MKLSFLKAAFIAAFSLSTSLSYAQARGVKSETYRDIIEKAQNLILQKDRQQALIILTNALQKETRSQAVQELQKTISEIAHVFLNDKTQQLYESGVALRWTDLNQSQEKMAEALRAEPDNIAITLDLSRIYIAKGDCSSALDLLRKNAKGLEFDEEVRLALAQSYVCLQKWVEYQKLVDSAGSKKSPQQIYWFILEIEKYLSVKNIVKAQETFTNLKKLDEKFPGVPYWSWRIANAQKKPAYNDAQKYVMTCKNISANQYRQYMMDPTLCRNLNAVESEQKGMNGKPK